MDHPGINDRRVEGFISSPISFSTYYSHVLKAEMDPLCNKSIVSLFIRFAGDYFYSCNFSQDPGDYRYPGRESAWSTIVRSFIDSPVSIQFIRDLTDLFAAYTRAINEVETRNGGGERHRKNGSSVLNEIFPSQSKATPAVIEKQSQPSLLSTTANAPIFCVTDSTANSSDRLHEWQAETHQDQPKRRIRYGLTKTHIRSNRNDDQAGEKKKWKVRLCEGEDCNKQPSFNWPGQKLRRFCADHRSPGMVDTGSRKCLHEGCMRQPHFNFQGQIRRFCSEHKAEGMVNVAPQLVCEYPDCKLRPSFNFPGIKRPRFCASHRMEGMVYPRSGKKTEKTTCRFEGCTSKPFFNFVGINVPKYCADHRQEGMVVLYRPRVQLCESESCTKASRYNFPGQKKKKFCEAHKQPGMIFLTNSPCEAENCSTQPRFNFKGQRKGRFCGQHKIDGMVDVTIAARGFCSYSNCDRPGLYKLNGNANEVYCQIHRQDGMVFTKSCRQKDCTEQPLFNFPGKRATLYCTVHKKDGMVLVHRNKKKCWHSNCSKIPQFNAINLRLPKFCEEHKSEGMVLVPVAPDCTFIGCKLPATHAYEDEAESPKHCSRHKLEGMVHIGAHCRHTGCTMIPTFNFEGERYGKYCVSHKDPNMVKVVKSLLYQCAYEKCASRKAPFYFPHDSQSRFCAIHKQSGMVHGNQRLCQHTFCKKFPTFDFKGNKGKGIFCSDHKLDGMVSLADKKACTQTNCTKRAVFNFEGQKEGELFCSEHKLVGMINVTGPKCGNEGCWRLAVYNFEGEASKKFCILHRAENMVPVLKTKCAYAGCVAPAFSQKLCSVHHQGILLI